MLLRLIAILSIFSSMTALGQIERDQRPPDLEAALIGSWPEALSLLKETVLPLSEAPAISDLALAFELQMESTSMGNLPQRLLSIESADGPLLTVSVTSSQIACTLAGNRQFSAPLATGAARHVAINIRRDPRQARSGIWIDGVELTSLVVRPGEWRLPGSRIAVGGGLIRGRVRGLRLFSRALDRPEMIALALRSRSNQLLSTQPEFTGSLDFRDGEVIVLLGGTDAVAIGEDWRFGAMLHLSSAGKRLRFRNLAWEADTVFRQDRPLGFGGLRQQLQRVEPTCILFMFGRQECLERGETGLADFEAALNRLLATCQEFTKRLAVIGAAPFEPKSPPLPDLSVSNPQLQRYNLAMERAARQHNALFVDVWSRLPPKTVATVDGMQWSEAGLYHLADAVLRPQVLRDRDYQMAPAVLRGLREPIEQSNRLWHDYWRPSNWAFLHGDRTAQPSSRDHVDPTKRWFPADLEKYQELMDAKEQEIWKLANDIVGGKLP